MNSYSVTAEELLVKLDGGGIPEELRSNKNLVYSSPATLAFNSPGANGFGVKRAGLAIPGSVMLLVAPGCCGRNTSALGHESEYADRFFYMLLDDTDIVTGRHLKRIPQVVRELVDSLEETPTAVMICITCVDALLGTDMDRVCRKASEAANVPVLPCYMYALTREGRLPPMTLVRQTVYSLLKPRKKRGTTVNILGEFSPFDEENELFSLLRSIGIKKINELSKMKSFEEYETLAEANFNLVLNPQAHLAAEDFSKKLSIPYIEMTRCYRLDKIARQYALLGASLGVSLDDGSYREMAEEEIASFLKRWGKRSFAVGECVNADPFELSLALISYGHEVKEIYGTVTEYNRPYLRNLAKISPKTRIYANVSPTMMFYDCGGSDVDLTVGMDAGYYHPDVPNVKWNGEIQPFGYDGVCKLLKELDQSLETEAKQNKEDR